VAEQPPGSPDTHAVQEPTSVPAFSESPAFRPLAAYPTAARRRGVVDGADLPPALGVLCGVALIGIPLGAIWAWLAPAQRVQVIKGGRHVPLAAETYHRYDDLAVFLLIGFGAGLFIGVATWLLRARRGPVVLLATVAGSLLGAWLAARTGLVFAGWHYPMPAHPQVGAILAESPRLESAWAVVAQPLAAALAYGTAAAWNGTDDLGTRRVVYS
jgi:hypothetical protein